MDQNPSIYDYWYEYHDDATSTSIIEELREFVPEPGVNDQTVPEDSFDLGRNSEHSLVKISASDELCAVEDQTQSTNRCMTPVLAASKPAAVVTPSAEDRLGCNGKPNTTSVSISEWFDERALNLWAKAQTPQPLIAFPEDSFKLGRKPEDSIVEVDALHELWAVGDQTRQTPGLFELQSSNRCMTPVLGAASMPAAVAGTLSDEDSPEIQAFKKGFVHGWMHASSHSSARGETDGNAPEVFPLTSPPEIKKVFLDEAKSFTDDSFVGLPRVLSGGSPIYHQPHHSNMADIFAPSLAHASRIDESIGKMAIDSTLTDATDNCGEMRSESQAYSPVVPGEEIPVTDRKTEPKKAPEKPKTNSKRNRKPTTLESDSVEHTDKDVLLGRGGEKNVHPGNVEWRNMLKDLQPSYMKASYQDKTKISQAAVDAVHRNGGRFLKMVQSTGTYHEVDNLSARTKTSQFLRTPIKSPQERRAHRIKYKKS